METASFQVAESSRMEMVFYINRMGGACKDCWIVAADT